MARTPKAGKSTSSRKKRNDNGGSEAPAQGENVSPGVGHNDLTDDQKRALFCQGIVKVERIKAQIASLTADVRNERKRMKADGFAPEEIDYALYLRKVDPDDAVELRKLEARVARWLAHPVGHQAELFGDGVDRTPSEDVAFEEGKTAGMSGETCTVPDKWAAGSPQGQRFIDGWHEGQGALMSGIKELSEEQRKADAAEFDGDAPAKPPPLDGAEGVATTRIH